LLALITPYETKGRLVAADQIFDVLQGGMKSMRIAWPKNDIFTSCNGGLVKWGNTGVETNAIAVIDWKQTSPKKGMKIAPFG